MEKDVQERFERIERNLETVTAVMQKQTEAQLRLTESLTVMNQSITKYVDASDARMAEIERSLKDLISAITSEHRNGKKGL
jgi:hypothetical protein